MKQLALCLVPILALVACGVDSSDITETSSSQETMSAEPNASGALNPSAGSPSLLGTCSTRSPAICSGATIGSVCSSSPRRWCLPANELPDGSILCGCQSQSTI
jgi:hypothetical protein